MTSNTTYADRRTIIGVLGSALLLVSFPPALAAYAHSRPISEATCISTTESLFDGRLADVTRCTNTGVTVSTSINPLEV